MSQPRTSPDVLTMIRELVALPSVSSAKPELDMSNRGVIDRLATWLDGMGFAVEILPLPEQPHKANLIATLGRGPGGLVLSGHTDTVPWDDGLWQHDPFGGVEADGRIYGLGTTDMKSFFALATQAASRFRAADLKEPLILLATADEETSMAGVRALVDAQKPKARYAVIGEPTNMRPIRMHKGIFSTAVELRGRSGHSSNPALGVNALEGMHHVIAALLRWREALQAQHHHPAFEVPVPTMNLGHIHGGDNPNRICGHCHLHVDFRPLPGMHNATLQRQLREQVEEAARDWDPRLGVDVLSLFDGIPPFETPADSEIVRVAEALTGAQAEAVGFGTEGPFLAELGLEAIVLGPGDIDLAHQPNEYLSTAQIKPTLRLLERLIERFCVRP
ncbi:MAG: acetylornithine deacetylase [Myxococcales bacterium]|nr:acetylornithine deacetylase [Myxococcales bacterium]